MTEINNSQESRRRAIPSLRSNFAWTFAGNTLYAGCQWGMLSVLAKLGSASIVGQFTLGLAVSAPIFMFTNLQLRAVQASDVNIEHGFADYFTLRLIATTLGLVVLAGILLSMDVPAMVKLVILLVSVSKTFECMSDVTAGLLQREEQLRRVAISLMIRGSASVITFSVIFARFRNLPLAVGSMCVVWLSVMVFYDLRNARAIVGPHESFIRFDRKALWRLTRLGLPLGWITTFTSLNANIPRYFLEHYRGLAEQGIYTSLAYMVIAVNLIASALSQSATTRLAHFFVAESAVPEIKAWYVKTFGAKPGKRGDFEAADIPGVNLTFSPSPTPTEPTKGRALDHIGFEVKDLEAFLKKLEANGVKLDRPYTKTPTGLAISFLTDRWGTYIELTEGLNKF